MDADADADPADPDQLPHTAASDQGIHCLYNYVPKTDIKSKKNSAA